MSDILKLRADIQSIDKKMLALFRSRCNISKEIAEYKATHNLPIYDMIREQDILKNIGLQDEKDFIGYIIQHSKYVQYKSIKQSDLPSNMRIRINTNNDNNIFKILQLISIYHQNFISISKYNDRIYEFIFLVNDCTGLFLLQLRDEFSEFEFINE